MLDPVSLGIALTLIAFIIAIVFFLSSGSDDFDKAYDENTRKLFMQDKEKGKLKNKHSKKKEKKTDKNEKEKIEPVGIFFQADQASTQPVKEMKKDTKPEIIEADVAKLSSIVQSDTNEIKKKKKKAKKDASSYFSSEKQKQLSEIKVNLDNLDTNKVLSRLSSLDEVEPEYISFLNTYFMESSKKISTLERQLTDSDKLVVLLKEAKSGFDRKIRDQQSQINDLVTKTQLLDNINQHKIIAQTECEQLRNTVKSLSITAQKQAATKQQFDFLKEENSNSVKQISRLEGELKNSAFHLNILKTEKAAIIENLNSLKLEFSALEETAQVLKSELNVHKQQYSEVNLKEAELSTPDNLFGVFQNEKASWERKEKQLLTEYQSLQHLVDDLNSEVSKFEQYKKEQDSRVELLANLENEFCQKERKLLKENNELVQCNKRLTDELSQLTKMAENFRITNADFVNNKKEDEVIEVEYAPSLNAFSDSDLSTIIRENEDLKAKNDELRQRNFKVLENFQLLEKRLESTVCSPNINSDMNDDRKKFGLLSNKISELLNIEQYNGDTSFTFWLQKVTESIEETRDKILTNSDDSYKEALIVLNDEIVNISKLYSEHCEQYKTRINNLESKLQQTQVEHLKIGICLSENIHCGPLDTLMSSKSDESDWEVIN